MQRLDRLEIHAANACNLTCESCSHFSNSGHRGVLSIEEAGTSFEAWKTRIAVGNLIILGGEPTLNPQLTQIILLARSTWPWARMALTTNAFFLHRHPGLGTILSSCRMHVNLSIHSEGPEYMAGAQAGLETLARWQETFGLRVHVEKTSGRWSRRHKGFGPNVMPFDDHDPDASWQRCEARHCRQLFRGRLWKCSPIAYLRLQKEAYPDISPAWDPYLAHSGLGPDCTDEELWAYLNQEGEAICGMCPAKTDHFLKPSPLIPRSTLLRQATLQREEHVA